MAPSPTSRLRLIKQETYSNPDAWGEYLNTGALDMADEGFGIAEIAVGANVVLDTQNFVTDVARRMVLILDGAGGFSVTAPAVDKPYLVVNDCAADVTMGPFGGAFDTIRAGTACWYVTDAAATAGRFLDATLDKIKAPVAPVDANGHRVINLGTPVDERDAATKKYIDDLVDVTDLGIVAAIADEIVTVAGIESEVVTVANNAGDVVIVSGGMGDVQNYARTYYGSLPANPATRPDGSAPLAGDLYFNDGADELRVFNGTSWQGGVTDVSNLVSRLIPQIVAGNTNALAGNAYYCDATGGSFDLTFPAAPTEGDRIGFSVGSEAETNPVTIKFSGVTFDGSTADLVVGLGVSLQFIFTSGQWRLSS